MIVLSQNTNSECHWTAKEEDQGSVSLIIESLHASLVLQFLAL